jgi:hypothetical protein
MGSSPKSLQEAGRTGHKVSDGRASVSGRLKAQVWSIVFPAPGTWRINQIIMDELVNAEFTSRSLASFRK